MDIWKKVSRKKLCGQPVPKAETVAVLIKYVCKLDCKIVPLG